MPGLVGNGTSIPTSGALGGSSDAYDVLSSLSWKSSGRGDPKVESDGKSWCPLGDWPNVSPYRLDSRVVCLDKYSLQAVCLDEHSIPGWKVIEDLGSSSLGTTPL